MNAECRELKVEDAIAMANDMYFINYGFSIDDCYTVACNLLEEY